jgi:hypothetical protein
MTVSEKVDSFLAGLPEPALAIAPGIGPQSDPLSVSAHADVYLAKEGSKMTENSPVETISSAGAQTRPATDLLTGGLVHPYRDLKGTPPQTRANDSDITKDTIPIEMSLCGYREVKQAKPEVNI